MAALNAIVYIYMIGADDSQGVAVNDDHDPFVEADAEKLREHTFDAS